MPEGSLYELDAAAVTARLITLVVELLLLGLALLLTVAEYRRARRLQFRPLLTALATQVLVVGTSGLLVTTEALRHMLLIPHFLLTLGLLQAIAIISLLTYFLRTQEDAVAGDERLIRWGLYGALGLSAILALLCQTAWLYGKPGAASLAQGAFGLYSLGLSIAGILALWSQPLPFRRWIVGSLMAFAFLTLITFFEGVLPHFYATLFPVYLAAEALAVLGLVAVAFIRVTADLTAIAGDLAIRSAGLEQASAALRHLQTSSGALLRAGSVKSLLTVLLDTLALQLGYRNAVVFLLDPLRGEWQSHRLSAMTGQSMRGESLHLARKLFFTEILLAGRPVVFSGSTQLLDQDFLLLTGFSKHVALVPLLAPRISYIQHGEPSKTLMQRGSAWKTEPCWLADRVCMQGLGNFPQRLDTCRTCPAFEPLGAIAVDLRGLPAEARQLDVLEVLGQQASLALRDLLQLEELVTDIRFRTAALDPLPLGIVLAGPDGRITAINRVVRQMAGPHAATWIGLRIGEVPLTTRQDVLGRITEELIRHPSEEAREMQVEVPGPSGTRVCALKVQPLLRNMVLTGVLFVLEDKTETRELQRTVLQQEQFAALGQLAMGIAHEVNNPIAGVSGLLQMLAKRLPAEASEQRPIQTAINDLKRASDTIRNLLQFARPKPANLMPVDLNALVQEVIDLQAFHPLAKNVIFKTDLDPALPLARTDRESLAQVLTNLLLNALQAMDGQGEIAVGSWRTSRGLLLTVRDTGPGIPAEIMPRIFEPFFTTKKAGQGTGLGLSLVEMLLSGMGSQMAVWTSQGDGTEFLILLPEERGASRTNGAAQTPSALSEPRA